MAIGSVPGERIDLDQFAIQPAQRDGWCIYQCAGELDMSTAPILRSALEQLTTDVTLDFTDVSFLDSSGIGALVAQYKRLSELGCTLRVQGLQETPRRTLEITGLLDTLTRSRHA
jgi:anti-sigma B factor antagonist